MTSVQFGVLGPLEIRAGSRVSELTSARQRRLLAALLVRAGEEVPVGRLLDALWGNDVPPTAVASLRTYVYRIRQLLGQHRQVLVTRPGGYALAVDPSEVDAGRFDELSQRARGSSDLTERLAILDEALALWRGAAYADVADEPFVRPEAVRLEERRLAVVEERFDTLLALGCHEAVVAELEAFVAEQPLRGEARRQLATALYRCGRLPDAVNLLQGYRTHLREELGLDLPPALESLERDLLRRDPSLELAPKARPQLDDAPVRTDAASGTSRSDPPPAANPLVGREVEAHRLRSDGSRPGLITITGVGGVGKTRLAASVAHDQTGSGAECWWCELGPVGTAEEVPHVVASTLGARPGEERDPTAAVAQHLRLRQGLLVLDNCEHVLDGVAPLVTRLLRGCPELTVLATSRVRLGVPGERVHRLGPLSVGDDDAPAPGNSPALDLFVTLAREARPDLDVTDDELATMTRICRDLDGLPLALELAASRLRSLNPTDLAARLHDRMDLIADERRSPPRHRELRAVLDWSYDLLSRSERLVFSRLSVFAGPFSVDAAEAVCAGDGVAHDEVIALLGHLVEHHLVEVITNAGPARYRLLEPVRAYGRERLDEQEEELAARCRHATYHVALAEAAARQIRTSDEPTGVARIDRAIDDLRAAFGWMRRHDETDLALRLCAALFPYALWRLHDEMFGWAESAASLTGATEHPDLPTVAGMAGWGAGLRGEPDAARRWVDRGMSVIADADDPRALVPLEVDMHLALWGGELERCLEVAERAAALTDDPYELVPHYVPALALTYDGRPAEALETIEPVQLRADRQGNPTMRAVTRYARGEALLTLDPPAAARPLREAAELAASVNNRMVLGVVDVSLVALHRSDGDTEEALSSFAAVVDRLHGAGDWTHLWTGLRGLVPVLARLRRLEEAAVLLEAVRTADTAPPLYGEDARTLAEVEQELEEDLERRLMARARRRARAMTDQEAVAFARDVIRSSLGD